MPGPMRSLVHALADDSQRLVAARAIALAVGATHLLIYVEDPELKVLLPAPGMAKTMPVGASWRQFLAHCRRGPAQVATVEIDGHQLEACSRVTDGCAFILAGAKACEFPAELLESMPLLAAVLCAQQETRFCEADASDARAAAQKAQELARALDAARAAAADLNQQLRAEHRRKDEFLAMLAHELRNPLAPMTSSVEIMRRSQPLQAPQLERHVALMTRQLQQLTHLVDDLLDVSRVSRGLIELRLEVLRLDEVLAAACESSRPLAESREQALRLHPGAAFLHVNADRVRLTQVFCNLLNNAAKYTPAGGCIDVEVEREGDGARVIVRDNGAGIPRQLLSSIFEIFAQVPGSLDRAPGGLGIGLTLVRTLVQLHGGSVSAESEGPDQGSTFTVWLPLVEAQADGPERGTVASAPAVRAARVMIVDDNVDAAVSLADVLQLLGAEVMMAHDGAHALEKARDGASPQLVLLDIGLPGMDGYETAREWRRRFGNTARLVALTGYGSAEDKRRSAQAGFDAHLVKPVSIESLKEILADLGGETLR